MQNAPVADDMALPDGEERLRQELEANLSSGAWPGGMRLPTERVLSEKFGIGRVRVRRVLDVFEREGRITRTVGRGTFVSRTDLSTPMSDADIKSVSPEDLMDVRLMIEPQMADLLVRRASEADLGHIRDLVALGRRSRSMAEFEELDHRFHMALTEAAKNTYLTGIIARIQAVRQSQAWSTVRRRGLTSDRQRTYQDQHEAIVAALEARDTDALRAALRRHLMDVRRNLGLG
ncbi:MAG: FCD domain-containing protein [Rhodobacteraceae bacterium]|nr:FCD domain-containing protein [Paracoccaceae bacterium]